VLLVRDAPVHQRAMLSGQVCLACKNRALSSDFMALDSTGLMIWYRMSMVPWSGGATVCADGSCVGRELRKW